MEERKSTSSVASTSSSSVICKICNSLAHGIHFGVVSCRACAAFFRRTIVEKCEKRYKCRGGWNICGVSANRRHQCRSCRFKKCISLGMTPNNIQWDRDPEMITNDRSDDETESQELEPSPKTQRRKPKRFIDVTPLKMEIQRVLNEVTNRFATATQPFLQDNPIPPEFEVMSKLEQVKFALKEWRKSQKPLSRIKILKTVPITKLFTFFDEHKISVAKFLSFSTDFRMLTSEQRFTFFKHVLSYLQKLERFEISVRMLGEAAVIDGKYMISSCSMLSKESDIKFGKVSDRPDEEMNRIFRDSQIEHFQKCAKELLVLKPKSIEVAFMLGELAWRIAGKEMQGEVLQISEKVRDELANDLHSFYQNNGNLQNYAGRVVKIMKSISLLIETNGEVKKTMELAQLFDIFTEEPSEPAFYGC